MYDGFMDTADGVFSARSRERMLEIMKDSHVGSNAVLAIIILLLLKIAAYLELSGETLTWVFTDDVRCDTNFYGSFYCQFSLCA